MDVSGFISQEISNNCGYCNQPAWFRLLGGFPALEFEGYQFEKVLRIAAAYECSGCQNASLFIYETTKHDTHPGWTRLEVVLPRATAEKMPDLPSNIEEEREEAWSCLHGGQNRAAILMARSALQRAARLLDPSLQGKQTGLKKELDRLQAQGIITKQLRDNAEEVRLNGNDVALILRT